MRLFCIILAICRSKLPIASFFPTMPLSAAGSAAVRPKDKRADLSYDIILNGRYHYEIDQQREQGQRILASTRRDEFWRSHGLQPEPSCLQSLIPALDLTMSRAYDVPHSEWKGLGRLMHDILIEVILKPMG